MNERYFSRSYEHARRRFRQAAKSVGASVYTYTPGEQSSSDLTVDVAVFGAVNANRTLVVTSGIHGVEGFFGSAVQLAWLELLAVTSVEVGVRAVLIHGINPYGFSQLRRFNEDNIDLNRNFPGSCNHYTGAPAGYAMHNRFLNPQSPPSRFEFFKLKAALKIWQHGMASLKESIAAGQYEYPYGLFYGGSKPAGSTRLICDRLESWLGQSSRVIHIDLHTGLGEYGGYKLLLNESVNSENYGWYEDVFGADVVEPIGDPDGTAYTVNGVFGAWCQEQNQDIEYRFMGAEFGTYDVVRVLKALREENSHHHFSSPEDARVVSAKKELLECFCPADVAWRQRVIESGLNIITAAVNAD